MKKDLYGVINWSKTKNLTKTLIRLLEREGNGLTPLEVTMAFELVKDYKARCFYERLQK